MKRPVIAVLVAGLATAMSLPLIGVASAADPENLANLAVEAGGIKKADVAWDDWTTSVPAPGPFDAYLVTADDDNNNAGLDSDRTKFVDVADPRDVTFDDLTSGTNYYFSVYAIDYTDNGVDIIPPSGTDPGTPIGFLFAEGSSLTINAAADVVLSGNQATLFGELTDDTGSGRVGETVSIQSDVFPFNGNDWVDEDTAETTGGGEWTYSPSPITNTRYRAFFSDPEGVGGWTRNVTVEVRKKITAVVAPSTRIPANTQITYSGKLGGDPDFFQPPLADPAVKACLRRLGSTNDIKCVTVQPNGTYSLTHRPGADQDGKYRIYSGMGPAYADSWSKAKKITTT